LREKGRKISPTRNNIGRAKTPHLAKRFKWKIQIEKIRMQEREKSAAANAQ